MDFPLTRAILHRHISERLHLGVQLALYHHGQLIADLAIGQNRPTQPLTPDSIPIWLSATKPIVAVAAAQLWEKSLFDLDDPVARFIPEFAQRGKESVTLRHLLTHTAGFRGVASTWTPGPWDQIISRISRSPLEPRWVPGQRAGYHVASSWFILGEIIHRLSGQPAGQYIRQHIFGPLSMHDSWLGIPPEAFPRYADRIGVMWDTTQDPPASQGWESQSIAAELRPGANGRGPAHDLARFYQAMLNKGELDGARILSVQSAEAMVARHRVGLMDETFRHVMDWGLGFIINSAYVSPNAPYGFGKYASPRTFGHGGSQSSVAFADPDHQLAGALLFNGMPGEARHDQRLRETLESIYEELSLT